MINVIGRTVTRPESSWDKIEEFNPAPPDLMIVSLIKSGAHHLKSNCVYEIVYNEFLDEIVLREIGEACIGKNWGKEYHQIQNHLGKKMWLTKEEAEKYFHKGE